MSIKLLKPLLKEQYNPDNFFLIAGPCVVEDEALLMQVAEKVSGICKRLQIPYIFKASYRKANRTSIRSFTGIGDVEGLELLQKTGKAFNLPVTSDIHSAAEAAMAAAYVDVLQIPAFLCRQTDILIAAADTGKVVNVKKGQFVSGESMKFAVEKIREAGNNHIILTERGTTFGYQDLVVDYRNIPIMKHHGTCPVFIAPFFRLACRKSNAHTAMGRVVDRLRRIADFGTATHSPRRALFRKTRQF